MMKKSFEYNKNVAGLNGEGLIGGGEVVNPSLTQKKRFE
jgi:hypothetical protein